MPAGKRQRDTTMVTLVIFVALFLIAAVVAVWSYANSESYRTRANELERQLYDLANRSEITQLASLVGARPGGDSWLGTLLAYHRQLYTLLMGIPGEATPAEVRSNTAQARVTVVMQAAQRYLKDETLDPNMGMVALAKRLIDALDRQLEANAGLSKQMRDLQTRMDDLVKASKEKELQLNEQVDQLKQLALEANKKAEEYRQLLVQDSDQRARSLQLRLDEERQRADRLDQELADAKAQIEQLDQRLRLALDKVQRIEPDPNRALELYRPDGRITVVDDHAGVVFINLGSRDRVYMGLTFGVYEGAGAVPPDGKGKAEVEVFDIMPDTCRARVVSKDPKRPIVIDDIVVNLLWDKDKVYKFALLGQFDVNRDGRVDPDGLQALSALIERWGAETTDEISPLLDAVIIGQPPSVPPKPTDQQLQIDPLAQERYEQALKEYDRYMAIRERAVRLMLPIIPYDTFLYLIGYRGKALLPGAF
ncbi:MAG: hypothetical protein QHH07_02235 [Sedimentisphaerales bacterium]|nr:hypothetical protein [Sedimentisphaerales bacterium]